MQITEIEITSMGCFDTFKAQLSSVVLLQGKNRAGKTSLLSCIKYPFDRGHDPDLVRGNKGEILITFDDGTMVRAVADREGGTTTRFTKPKDGKKWDKGRELIDAIARSLSYDPLQFLKLNDAQQLEAFLKIIPVSVEAYKLKAAVVGAEEEAGRFDARPGMNGLEVINAIRSCIYDERRKVNTEADTHEKYAAQMHDMMRDAGAPDGSDWKQVCVSLRKKKSDLEDEERAVINGIAAQLSTKQHEEKLAAGAAAATVDRDIDAKIKALEAERGERKKVVRDALDEALSALQKRADAARGERVNAIAPQKESVTGELAVAEQRAGAQEQLQGQMTAVEKAQTLAASKRLKSETLTAVIERLDALKVEVAGAISTEMPGVTLDAGRICRDEDGKLVPLSKWNTAGQFQFALRMGVKAHGKAGFLCLDGAEVFDKENLRALIAAAQQYSASDGLQFIVATVGDGPLEVVQAGKE